MLAVYNHGYYGDQIVCVTKKTDKGNLEYWSFMGDQSWSCCSRRDLRHLTPKEKKRAQVYIERAYREAAILKKACEDTMGKK